MITREELCNKITEVFPDIGVCGIDLEVEFDKENKAWKANSAFPSAYRLHSLKRTLKV